MRSWPAQLVTEAKSTSPRLAQALLIRRADGETLALTSADIVGTVADVPIGGSVEPSITFAPTPEGVAFSAWQRSLGTDVDNAECEILEGPNLLLADVLDRRWHGAAWVSGIYSWAHPEYGFGPVSCGVVGQIKVRLGRFVMELRDLRQLLGGNPTPVTQRNCLWLLGSNSERDGWCGLDLTPYTVTGVAVTAVASQREFTAASLAGEPADRYGNGLLTWTAGLNTGRQVRVTAFTAGVFQLDDDMVQGITDTDVFAVIWGCRNRFAEDCVIKFNNARRFGGFPHSPGPDKSLNPPGVDT